MPIKLISVLASFCICLTGCQVVETADNKKSVSMLPLYIPKEERYLDIRSDAPIAEKRELYVAQLVSPTQKYATIKTIPYTFFQGSGSLSAYPYTIYTFDQKRVKFAENSILSPSTTMSRFDYSQLKVKLPIGQHDIVFVSGVGSHSYFTEIKNVHLEENKDYVIGIDQQPNAKPLVFIAEYEVDSRFKANEPESIIIKKRIVEGIEHANLKNIKTY
ncbi:hypothetical protein [Acinetobacter rathckeae]|uniref:hypothetical protein n=1 Tax=Acinetobacter rathckeae TaxID=2605272 RepID=UPI0018A2EA39|nr:hypothetical protein [Acinetobacter rathckeae]MBF7687337.1 hypothetical protein [Acinetobacter rathckeae]